MEFVPGKTLKHLVKAKGVLDEATAIRYMHKVAEALAAAHHKGIVHRDVKPENIMLDEQGEPRLGDLGLAKPMSGDFDVTMGGVMLGTPFYIAPEQAKGETVDGRSDIYSLAATFYHLLCGKPLFTANTTSAVAIKHVNEPPPAIRTIRGDISPAMEAVLLKCLQKHADARYQSCAELIADLGQVEAGVMPLEPGRSAGRRRNSAKQPLQRGHHRPKSSAKSPASGTGWRWDRVIAAVVVIAIVALGGGR